MFHITPSALIENQELEIQISEITQKVKCGVLMKF